MGLSGSSGAFTQYSHNGGAGSVVGAPDASTLAFYTYTGNIGSETYTERARIDSDGLKFHGDTAAANALNDYEEGTWTLGLGGVSASLLSSGTSLHNVYTKIGRVVRLDGYFAFTSNSSEANMVQITGLPFTVKSNTYSSGSQINQNGSGAGMTILSVSGTEYLNLYTNDNNSSQGFNGITYSEVGQMAMHFSITYITDQ